MTLEEVRGYIDMVIDHEREIADLKLGHERAMREAQERYQNEKVVEAKSVADAALHTATNNVNDRLRSLERTGDGASGRSGLSQQLVLAIALALGSIGGGIAVNALQPHPTTTVVAK